MSSSKRKRRMSHHPISVLEFNHQYRGRIQDGEVEEEFGILQDYCTELNERKSRDIGRKEENKPKNRFVDIVPCAYFTAFLQTFRFLYTFPSDDDTLVTLKEPSGNPPTTYINASFIKDFNEDGDVYIATQGPKRNTVVDFWNMILEHNIRTIVCLTNIVEAGRVGELQAHAVTG